MSRAVADALARLNRRAKPQLHVSALETLQKCGQWFDYAYLQRLYRQPSSAIHIGKGVDIAATSNLQQKIDTDELMPVEQVRDLAADATRISFDKEGVTISPDEPRDPRAVRDLSVDRAVRLAELHSEKVAPRLKPQRVQVPFTLEIVGCSFDLAGQRDVDEADGIRDLKTARKSPPKNAAHVSDQVTTYALSRFIIDKMPTPIRFALDYVIDLKRGPKELVLETTRTESDFQALANRIGNAARIIESGMFTPARSSDWWCSETYCPYTGLCPYFRRPVTLNIGGSDDGTE